MGTNEMVELVENLTKRPAMFVGRESYVGACAYLGGIDHALGGSFLAGFHEWLTMKFGRWHNVHWSAIPEFELLGNGGGLRREFSEQEESQLLNSLRELLIEYLRYRQEVGLRNVYYDHGKWLRQHSWFDENVERYGSSAGPKKKTATRGRKSKK